MQEKKFPRMIRVRQTFDRTVLEDVVGTIHDQINALAPRLDIKAGQTVAVACSSRGLSNYATIVKAVVSALKQKGL
ncbi:MAG: DUF362 domain-containing protein, partial [Desulfobacterales bacterium]